MRRTFFGGLTVVFSLLLVACGAPVSLPDVRDVGTDAVTDIATADTESVCHADIDCSNQVFCDGAERCMPGSPGANSRGCLAPSAPACLSSQTCNEAMMRCETACDSSPDADHDGHRAISCGGDDCDDSDPNRYPGNQEVCAFDTATQMRVAPTHDEDCDPTTLANGTTGDGDRDGDGYVDRACCNVDRSGMRFCGLDCADTAPITGMAPFQTMVDPANVRPFQAEVCNGIDDNCNGTIDEGLPDSVWYRDCDGDGFGDSADPGMHGCGPDQIVGCNAHPAVRTNTDCDDANHMRNPGLAEICNGIDDDCNTIVDDLSHGTVFCHLGESSTCTTGCGLSGARQCSATCLSWDSCTAPEVCNACDDDNNGNIDDGFACIRGTSESCVEPLCGTTGTRTCDTACTWGVCRALDICNYCDDNGNGNIFEERPLATLNVTDHMSDCSGGSQPMFGTGTSCYTTPTSAGFGSFDLWAQLLDGNAQNQAGALWLDPSAWMMGWGPVQVNVEMEVTAVTAGGAYEMPLGGWGVIIGHGTMGVGAPDAGGVPTTITGVAARWFWSQFDSSSSAPPSNYDSFRGFQLSSTGMRALQGSGTSPDWGLFSGDLISGGAVPFDGVGSGPVTEQIQLRYTPDDPTTPANEEAITITAGTPGAPLTHTYIPSAALPIGAGPLRIGITAGTYTQSGFAGPPPGSTFGVPVRARVRVMNQTGMCCGSPSFTYPVTIARNLICP